MRMKILMPGLMAVSAIMAVFSCTKESPVSGEVPVAEAAEVTISATISDVLTKVAFDPSYEAGKPESMSLAWAEGDALRIYNHADRSRYDDFTLDAGSVGQKKGSFTGTPSNIVSASSFDVEVIGGAGFDYAAQSQPSDGVTTGLKYLASVSGVTDYSSVEFTDFSSVLAITAKMPSTEAAAAIKSVDITANEAIFNGGNNLTITLGTTGDAGEDSILHLFATLPEGSRAIAAGTTLVVHFNAPGTSHDIYTRFITLGEKTFTAGKLNAININASESDRHAGDPAVCDGTTAARSYLIGDKYQMQALRDLARATEIRYFKMIDDVDLDGISWTPVNNISPYNKGVFFDGDNHTIDNLTCGSTVVLPSFMGLLNGTIQNVRFDNASISFESRNGGVVAGFIGYVKNNITGNCINVEINNSTVECTAASKIYAGILAAIGDNLGTVEGCKVKNSSVTSTLEKVGGLFGQVNTCTVIEDCVAENVTVTTDIYYGGGLIGEFNGGTLKNCLTSGSVTSNKDNYSRTGGLVGIVNEGTIENCCSACNVTVAGQFGGGLIGEMKDGTITGCSSTGTVTSTNHYSGGLVGVATGTATIEKSFFNGTISLPTGGSGKAQAGGIVSYMETGSAVTISNCYSSGSWAGRRWFGGIVGGVKADAAELSITNCYTTASITGTPYGALIGNNALASGVTASGNIAWWASGNICATGTALSSGCYIGQEGTIKDKAVELGWDGSIWDLTVNPPTLR